MTGGNFKEPIASSEVLMLEQNDLTMGEVKWRRWTLLNSNLHSPLVRPVLTHINNVVYLTGQASDSGHGYLFFRNLKGGVYEVS